MEPCQDGVQLATGEAGQVHELVSVTRLSDIGEELLQHPSYSNGHPHIGHVHDFYIGVRARRDDTPTDSKQQGDST